MRYLAHSEPGHDHANEDCVAVRRHLHDAEALICVLADGQGGQFGGGAASRAAVAKCLELASVRSVEELLERATWREIVTEVDEAVEQQADAGFATLIGLCVTPTVICGASCGDSAAVLVSGENFAELTAKQRKNPPLGSGAAQAIPFQKNGIADSTLLLISDGVWKFVGFDRIAASAREWAGQELQELVAELRELQLEASGGKLPDDFSIIAVERAR